MSIDRSIMPSIMLLFVVLRHDSVEGGGSPG